MGITTKKLGLALALGVLLGGLLYLLLDVYQICKSIWKSMGTIPDGTKCRTISCWNLPGKQAFVSGFLCFYLWYLLCHYG